MSKTKYTQSFTYLKSVILIFIFFNPGTSIGQPFEPVYNQLSSTYIASYPTWPAKGYVVTNSGDSITGTITNSSKKFGFFLLSITLDGKEYKAQDNKAFGFLAYLDKGKHFYRNNKPPCGSSDLVLSILRYDTQIDPNKGNKVFMWKMVDEPGLVVYQNPSFSFTHTVESGSITTITDSVKVKVNKENIKLELSDFLGYDGYDERNLVYDDCGNLVGYLNKDKSIFRTDIFSHSIVKGMEEDYFYDAYYLVAEDGSLIKLNNKNYAEQWSYLWKGCQAVDDFARDKKNYDKIKKFMRLVSVYGQQCN